MKIYSSRYYAKKEARNNEVIVKVCAGGNSVGYVLMTASNYKIWKKQK